MAFCSSCGGHLESNERFCAKCGAEQPAQAAGAPAVPSAAPQVAAPQVLPPQTPAPQAAIPPPLAQPYAGMPPQYPPPIIMGAPPGTQPASKNPLLWLVAAGVIFGLWYIGTHDNNSTPGGTP